MDCDKVTALSRDSASGIVIGSNLMRDYTKNDGGKRQIKQIEWEIFSYFTQSHAF
jgi:hypothetical protein